MVLDAEYRIFFVSNPFDRLIVQVQMGYFDVRGERIRINGKPMILRSDRYLSGSEILNRLVAAPMTEFQFKCFAAVRESQQLMTEANPEYRTLTDQLL